MLTIVQAWTALILASALIWAAAQTNSVPTYRADVNLVPLAVRVTDRSGSEVRGLRSEQFVIYEDGIRQNISFFAAEEEPLSLGVLLDVSSSMSVESKLRDAKQELARLIRSLRAGDEVFYLEFHRNVDEVVPFTSDIERVVAAVSQARAKRDGTSLYDAIARGLCFMRGARYHRRALLVITDGADQHSRRSLGELIPIVQASPSQLFTIGYFGPEEYALYRARGPRVTLVTSQEIDNPLTVFRRLANESGAEAFFPPSSSQLREAVQTIAHQLRTQYTLAYYTGSHHHRGFRRIDVRVTNPKLRVRARRGFSDSEIPGERLTGECDRERLPPYPYESKVETRNGCAAYREDFLNSASGWPGTKRYRYASGAYELSNKRAQRAMSRDVHPYSFSPELANVGGTGDGDRAQGIVVANGPWFTDVNAAIHVTVIPADEAGEFETAAGLVFRLNDRGYYAILISRGARKTWCKVLKKYHSETNTRDIVPWTEVSLSDVRSGPQTAIAVACRGAQITVRVEHTPVAAFNDSGFAEGVVGMALYGSGRAVFRGLTAAEPCADAKPQ